MTGLEEGFEESGINWQEFADTLPGIINTTTEAMIAEIVDNSLDQDCDKIKIELFGSNWDDLAIIVYDDGNGFIDEENMDASFELSNRPGHGGENARIGKFNIGLKLTPLSRCDTVIAHSIGNDGQMLYRCLDKPAIRRNGVYGTIKKRDETALNQHIVDSMILDGWKTAIAMTNFRKRPEIQGFSIADKQSYGKHITTYLGLIYANFLRRKYVEIKMHGEMVVPKDPFWSSFTPTEIVRRLELPVGEEEGYESDEHKYIMECFIEWGTVSTPTRDIVIEVDGGEHIISVTGYSIPPTAIRGQIPELYRYDCFWTGPSNQETATLRAKNLSGLYFYRNGRCVCFGNTGPDSNDGWYSLVRNVEPHHHITRFHVEFPESLDDWIGLAPNKDRVSPPSDFFDKFIQAMGVVVTRPKLRGPLADPQAFFVRNYSKQQTSAADICLAGLNYKYAGSYIQRECPHCNAWHYNQTVCPKAPTTPIVGGSGGGAGGSGGGAGGGAGGSGGSSPSEESSIVTLIDKVILKLVSGDETNEDKIQQAREYLENIQSE